MSCPVIKSISCSVLSCIVVPLMAVSAASRVDSSPLVASWARGEEKAVSRDCTDARPSCLRTDMEAAAAAAVSDDPSPPALDDADDDDEAVLVLVLGVGGVNRVARAVQAADCTAGLAVSPRPLKQQIRAEQGEGEAMIRVYKDVSRCDGCYRLIRLTWRATRRRDWGSY